MPQWVFGYIPPEVLPCMLDDPVSQHSVADCTYTGRGYTAKTQCTFKDPPSDINNMITIS